MKSKGRFVIAGLVLSGISSHAWAETFQITCRTQPSGEYVKRIILNRDDAAPCKISSGQTGEIDVLACASVKIESSDGKWDNTASFNLTCYSHQNGDDQTLSCTGFNGPYATFSIVVNRDLTFASSYIYSVQGDKQNTIAVNRGICVDEN